MRSHRNQCTHTPLEVTLQYAQEGLIGIWMPRKALLTHGCQVSTLSERLGWAADHFRSMSISEDITFLASLNAE